MLTGHVAPIQGLSLSLTMDNGLKIATILGLSLIALPASAVPLSSQTVSFSGNVSLSCDLISPPAPVTMTSAGATLSGQTSTFYYEANGAVKLSLSPIAVSSAPSGTGSYAWLAELRDAGTLVASRNDVDTSAAEVPYNSGLTSSNTFVLDMTVSSNTSSMAIGVYTGAVTLDCLVP